MISVLDKDTIDKIAAGEVVEKPASIVKELLENAIDAGSTQIAIEIKDGGTSLIRITDNGFGIENSEVRTAFLRHATSKLKNVSDLDSISSLGFRGEALSSISAVTKTEFITKTKSALLGTLYKIEGGVESEFKEVAAPDGTSIIVRDLFYNIPARRKFLKSNNAEMSYISDIVEKLALANTDISFRYISNNINKLHTLGNGNLKDVIYQIYGKDAAKSLINIDFESEELKIKGFIAKPDFSKSNRNNEVYFINGRYIKNTIIAKAIEDAYGNRLMQGKYPFVVFNIEILQSKIDINVHPSKMELKFEDPNLVYSIIKSAVENVLLSTDLIKKVSFDNKKEEIKSELLKKLESSTRVPEIFEYNRLKEYETKILKDSFSLEKEDKKDILDSSKIKNEEDVSNLKILENKVKEEKNIYDDNKIEKESNLKNEDIKIHSLKDEIFEDKNVSEIKVNNSYIEQITFLDERAIKKHKFIGQIFSTYLIIEYDEEMYIVDQHAAHEKVLYERFLKTYKNNSVLKQVIFPPVILTLSDMEISMIENNIQKISNLGFDLEYFGGREYKVNAVPTNLPSLDKKEVLKELIDTICETGIINETEKVISKIASLSCKAAIKAGHKMSLSELDSLFSEMMELNNPYNCPHGRPTIIKMSKSELEKKFKRIV